MILAIAFLVVIIGKFCLVAAISSRRDNQPIRSKEFWL